MKSHFVSQSTSAILLTLASGDRDSYIQINIIQWSNKVETMDGSVDLILVFMDFIDLFYEL